MLKNTENSVRMMLDLSNNEVEEGKGKPKIPQHIKYFVEKVEDVIAKRTKQIGVGTETLAVAIVFAEELHQRTRMGSTKQENSDSGSKSKK